MGSNLTHRRIRANMSSLITLEQWHERRNGSCKRLHVYMYHGRSLDSSAASGWDRAEIRLGYEWCMHMGQIVCIRSGWGFGVSKCCKGSLTPCRMLCNMPRRAPCLSLCLYPLHLVWKQSLASFFWLLCSWLTNWSRPYQCRPCWYDWGGRSKTDMHCLCIDIRKSAYLTCHFSWLMSCHFLTKKKCSHKTDVSSTKISRWVYQFFFFKITTICPYDFFPLLVRLEELLVWYNISLLLDAFLLS